MATRNAVDNTLSGQSGTGAFAGSTSPTFVTPTLGTPNSGNLINCTGLPVAGGGTGVASTTAYAVICGGTTTTAALQNVSNIGTSGQVLTSNGAGMLPTFQGLPASFTWNNVNSASATMVANNGYLADYSLLVRLTLPMTAAFGTVISVIGYGSGGWTILLNSGQTVQVGSVTTTATTGSVSSTNKTNSIQLVCIVANTVWANLGAPQGNLTIV